MTERSNIISYLEGNKERLMREYHLTTIGLFGSFSREQHNETSDIDIVVEFEPGTQNLYFLKQNLRQEIPLNCRTAPLTDVPGFPSAGPVFHF